GSAGTGIETRSVAPPPALFLAVIVPPTSRTICTEIGRPSPVPIERVVKNGSKIFSMNSFGIPTPPSRNETSTTGRRARVRQAPAAVRHPLPVAVQNDGAAHYPASRDSVRARERQRLGLERYLLAFGRERELHPLAQCGVEYARHGA